MQSPEATLLTCTQCGGELHPDEGQIFITCPYCSATVYVDKSRVVFHWYVAPTLNEQQAQGALFRWMSGSKTVKDLDKKAQVTGRVFQFFPLWYFKAKTEEGEQIHLRPAAATAITELSHLPLPAGDLRRYEDSLNAQSVEPSVPLSAALDWLGAVGQLPAGPASGPPPRQAGPAVQETALVHVPVYLFKYAYRGQQYSALVDAASGMVLANLFPAKAEAPYLLVGIVTALIYLCLALAPLVGAFADSEGVFAGAAICIGAGLLVAPILFLWAYWVAAKV
jgi:predicted RNA-binding Zn-ribbon protein involved in translation (DUF1610 family)